MQDDSSSIQYTSEEGGLASPAAAGIASSIRSSHQSHGDGSAAAASVASAQGSAGVLHGQASASTLEQAVSERLSAAGGAEDHAGADDDARDGSISSTQRYGSGSFEADASQVLQEQQVRRAGPGLLRLARWVLLSQARVLACTRRKPVMTPLLTPLLRLAYPRS